MGRWDWQALASGWCISACKCLHGWTAGLGAAISPCFRSGGQHRCINQLLRELQGKDRAQQARQGGLCWEPGARQQCGPGRFINQQSQLYHWRLGGEHPPTEHNPPKNAKTFWASAHLQVLVAPHRAGSGSSGCHIPPCARRAVQRQREAAPVRRTARGASLQAGQVASCVRGHPRRACCSRPPSVRSRWQSRPAR